MEQAPKIKGAAFREFVLWYERTHDAERLQRAIAGVPEDRRADLRPDRPGLGILASSWYPVELAHVLLDAVMEGRTEAECTEIVRDGTRAIVDTMLWGVYRFLFERVSTPSRYARHIHRLWHQLHSSGERRMEMLSGQEADSVIERWPGHHPLLCEITIYTMANVFGAMRCRDVQVIRTACVSQGDAHCRARLTWDGPD